jgi:hypothetical protein
MTTAEQVVDYFEQLKIDDRLEREKAYSENQPDLDEARLRALFIG